MDTVPAAFAALEEIVQRPDPTIVGVVLSGSAARGMATEHSDVDVYVVRAAPPVSREQHHVLRSAAVDEIPISLADLEQPPAYGTDGWWFRWSFAWAQVLRDDTGGRITAAVHRQAVLDEREQRSVLDHRLDGYINLVYRALKSDRDGRPLECRLDAAESVPWLLDVVFALAGRVRPYNKYLPWELREHPLEVPEWRADVLLPRLSAMLEGDTAALRAAFATVDRECRRYDGLRGDGELAKVIDAWGDELELLSERGARRSGGPCTR